MKTEFTKEYIVANQGCYIETPGKVESLPFINNGTITIRDLFDGLPIKDFTWFLAKKCELTLIENVALAIHCAEFSLKYFEEKYPDDKRPFEAIQAAKSYLSNPSARRRLCRLCRLCRLSSTRLELGRHETLRYYEH